MNFIPGKHGYVFSSEKEETTEEKELWDSEPP